MEFVRLDITDPESIAAAVSDVLQRHPDLNVLVNNAGMISDDDPAEPIDDEILVRTVETNLVGPIRMISAVIEHLRATPRSTIINVTSLAGYTPMAKSPLYSATKAAMHSYTLSLRYRLGDTGPKVVEIAPPYTRTAFQQVNLSDPRAMPLEAFLAETLIALERGDAEAYVPMARERRDAQRQDDIAATEKFNTALGTSPALSAQTE